MINQPKIDVRDIGFTNLSSLNEALKIAKNNISLNDIEIINLRELLNYRIKILAEDIYARYNVPNFTRSTMDGFAIRSIDVEKSSSSNKVSLKVIEELSIGKKSSWKVEQFQAIKIPTGGILPEGADAVIKIEDVTLEEHLSFYNIIVDQPVEMGKNISEFGDDFKKGELVFKKGRLLTSIDIGVILSIGISKIKCYKVPRIGIVSTGDEIVDEDRELEPGEVYDTNSYVLLNYLKQLGFHATRYKIIHDNFDYIKESVEKILNENDIILTTGGTSVGKKDYMPLILNELSTVLVHGISIKPGSPTTLGIKDKKICLGLPGFPVSSLVSFIFFGIPVILHQLGTFNVGFLKIQAYISKDYDSILGRTDLLRVSLRFHENKLEAVPITVAGSSLLRTLSTSDGIVVIDDVTEKLHANSLIDVQIIDKLVNFE